ncbi:hypothetical protein WICMUC_001386 [Wickerhamomyces mucosus]|uniref:WD40 repeat-like protein n=1 Tax=Wickerhamomyces mucosus TaxID=1378264 RepID=A0A9P8PVY0_9ASCO|nr:hypothetical protein WICMUC_001386 [Wickerhamomyces mucosus]
MSRRSEIEAKRQRLEELKKQREQRSSLAIERSINENKDTPIDELVGNLVDSNVSASVKSSAPSVSTSKTVEYKSISIQTEIEKSTVPREIITYSKGIQTVEIEPEEEKEETDEEVTEEEKGGERGKDTVKESEQNDEEIIINSAKSFDTDYDNEPLVVDDTKISIFLTRSFKIINRALQEEKDILRDYKKSFYESSLLKDNQKTFAKLKDLKLPSGIYSFDISTFSRDLLAISTGNEVFIYNLHFQNLEAQISSISKVTNVRFSKVHSNLLIGTCFNGKIKIWDLDESKRSSVYLESTTSIKTHSYPISSIIQKIENNAEILTTCSTDGKICNWKTLLLSHTVDEPITLKPPKSLGLPYDELTPTTLIQLGSEFNSNLLLGSEDGKIYAISKINLKENQIEKVFEHHSGPITSLSISEQFPNFFLSSSFDWKCLMWDLTKAEPVLQIYKNDPILKCQLRPYHETHLSIIYGSCFEIISSITSVSLLTIETESILNNFIFTDENHIVLGSVDGVVSFYEIYLESDSNETEKFRKKHL